MQGRGADPRARPAPAGVRERNRAGRHLSRQFERFRAVRPPAAHQLPRGPRHQRQLRQILRHDRGAGDVRDRPPGPDRRDPSLSADRRLVAPDPQSRPGRAGVKRTILAAAIVMWLSAAPAALASAQARASLTDIENDVMCVSCREPLAVAESPQAYAERDFIRTLIAQGQTKSQIEAALVGQYGPAVLGRPPAHGFNLTVYVLPPALVLLGLAALAVT